LVLKRMYTEVAGRTRRIAGAKLKSRNVAEMLAAEALNGEVTPLLLLLRLSRCLEER
jgi:hypothetical protein